jgi:four helix bundle protein
LDDNPLVEQSINFSILIISYYKWLCNVKKEYVMSKQLLRSGTSIGANVHEACYAISRADFINKMQIALKEASETEYWLIILEQTGYHDEEFLALKTQCISIKKK